MKPTKVKLLLTLTLISCVNLFFANKTTVYPEGFKPKEAQGISFTENKGQIHDQNYKPRPDVLFGAMAGNMTFHLKTNGVSYQLTKVDSYKDVVDERTNEKRKEIDQQTIYRIDLSWLNANTNFVTSTDKTLEGYTNYYLENFANGALNVKNYSGVTLHNLYNGINLHYYEKDGQLKHDYIVAPNADYKQIQLKVEGASISIKKDGSLILNTPLGKVQEGAPIVYQNGKQLKAEWKVNNNTLSFEIENYNPNQELIIDPVTRAWGTYYGGSGEDRGESCATDASGNVYLTGVTNSNSGTVIATTGSHQSAFGGGTWDSFLVKFNSSGARQWSTYYGGAGAENTRSCALDASGNVYVVGETVSSNTVLATAGAHQTSNGGTWDAFLVKFNSSGVRQWGTYYGGIGDDRGQSCATDASGNVYLVGFTDANTGTVIATSGAHQSVYGGGIYDVFLVKFNSSGARQWGTYYGGSLDDRGYSCATDASGNVYVAGQTASNIVLATAAAHQTSFGGNRDAFLVKFNSSGVRQWGTYYGGNGDDRGYSCAIDVTGNVYLVGLTDSNIGTVIATTAAHQNTYGGGTYDAYLVKFNSSGIRQWGTYYGGTGSDFGQTCITDAMGNVFFSGSTSSINGVTIASTNAYQTIYGGSAYDGYLVKFNASGLRQWGTYYGGSSDDYGSSCAIDGIGNLYLAGLTSSSTGTVIASSGSHQSVYGGGPFDGYLVKLNDCNNVPANPTGANVAVCANNSATLTATSSGANISWFASPTSTLVLATGTVYTLPILSAGTYTYYAEAITCTTSIGRTAISVTVNANPTIAINSGAICSGNSFTLNPSGASTYTIQGGNTIVNPTSNASYTVIGTSVDGCVSSNVATANVTVNASPTITINSGSICSGNSFTLNPSGANTYTLQGGSAVVNPTANASYTVIGTSTAGCVSQGFATSNVTVNALPSLSITSTNSLLCTGESSTLTVSGANTYTWNTTDNTNAISISPTITTTYTVNGIDINGCENSSTITQSVSLCTGLEEAKLTATQLLIYPNPFSDRITIETKAFNKTILLYNVLGETVKVINLENEKTEIDLSELKTGIYFIKTGFNTVKVIKQ